MRRTLNSAIEKLKLKFETHMMKKVCRFSFDNFSNGILYVEALIVVYANFKIFFKICRNCCNYIITLLCDMNFISFGKKISSQHVPNGGMNE